MEWFIGIGLLVVALITIWVMKEMPNGPYTCPKCKKEFDRFTERHWDYHSEYTCPHCNYEYNMMP